MAEPLYSESAWSKYLLNLFAATCSGLSGKTTGRSPVANTSCDNSLCKLPESEMGCPGWKREPHPCHFSVGPLDLTRIQDAAVCLDNALQVWGDSCSVCLIVLAARVGSWEDWLLQPSPEPAYFLMANSWSVQVRLCRLPGTAVL